MLRVFLFRKVRPSAPATGIGFRRRRTVVQCVEWVNGMGGG